MPPLQHIGKPVRKNITQNPTTIHFLYLFKDGFQSVTKATRFWTPPTVDDNARLTNMKKKRKDQRGATSISKTADGYDTNAKAIPLLTTSSMVLPVAWLSETIDPSMFDLPIKLSGSVTYVE